jgi:hypothetical protein
LLLLTKGANLHLRDSYNGAGLDYYCAKLFSHDFITPSYPRTFWCDRIIWRLLATHPGLKSQFRYRTLCSLARSEPCHCGSRPLRGLPQGTFGGELLWAYGTSRRHCYSNSEFYLFLLHCNFDVIPILCLYYQWWIIVDYHFVRIANGRVLGKSNALGPASLFICESTRILKQMSDPKAE